MGYLMCAVPFGTAYLCLHLNPLGVPLPLDQSVPLRNDLQRILSSRSYHQNRSPMHLPRVIVKKRTQSAE